MRWMDHARLRARTAARRALGRLPLADPALLRPATLVLRAGTPPAAVGAWRSVVVEAVGWLGPLEVTLRAEGAPPGDAGREALRVARRLECPTRLVTDGTGVDAAVALELAERGLGAALVLVGGVGEAVHRAVVGSALADARRALRALLDARDRRGAPVEVEVGLPWRGPADAEARALLRWTRDEVRADALRVLPPGRSVDVPVDPELLDELAGSPGVRLPDRVLADLHALAAHADGGPGLPRAVAARRRRLGRCPVAAQRLEVDAAGALRCCPFREPLGRAGDAPLPELWAAAGPHLRAVRACDRACTRPDLAPAPLLGALAPAGSPR